ncbi:purine-nucleoside phosphorylase [Clostridium tagluense]|uniref:Uridine phosphorylase n=1 Tax=Clostridium tagluense TaxID=360422 RepID=A0A401UMA7_9CLOT|nr:MULTISPECIES: purine-nucleoside phosphorylase [Clostridium]MBU3126200.1 purine-nucleoside phosphorylase [Clostridium tagluense]MBW9155881.1 purine-nucleoside phosphorylase [Clostridium tagluense]MBZ9624039.1 purine-nucleoside phosphorylase [Clostridium sp. FP2]MCB2298332.1 purine-nucleoside phosphorylase [Clostridium tagluense]MCB2309581.1 purine-nucleoside phosphorylase [Clostridium tagluense]
MIPTAHIEVKEEGIIAKTVLMPGDPLRAQFIAETFLENVEKFNNVRNVFGYTGTYKGRKISVMASGMGMPSIGIYSYELFNFYGVENIIRIGSCGAYTADLNLYDVILTTDAWSESTYAKVQSGCEDDTIAASVDLNNKLEKIAEDLGIKVHKNRVHSSDVFYRENFDEYKDIYETHGCTSVEMESFALFHNANVLGKKAACLLTVSDNLVTHELTTSEERQEAFTNMMKIALEMAE